MLTQWWHRYTASRFSIGTFPLSPTLKKTPSKRYQDLKHREKPEKVHHRHNWGVEVPSWRLKLVIPSFVSRFSSSSWVYTEKNQTKNDELHCSDKYADVHLTLMGFLQAIHNPGEVFIHFQRNEYVFFFFSVFFFFFLFFFWEKDLTILETIFRKCRLQCFLLLEEFLGNFERNCATELTSLNSFRRPRKFQLSHTRVTH